ncbi:hypothetical protein GMI69_07270 [Eggerthellaceae bacterium zg-887]|uniref:hypothetical protein n=1 Tax=Xiamenia xianingshaonis TaxID=2682776 RepID=UPI00140CCD35|nr:hypothetical protein [Xiamenia xianingshaonis]NHM16454.1 hypothetical protein [Xiamenia xianingshaonis]
MKRTLILTLAAALAACPLTGCSGQPAAGNGSELSPSDASFSEEPQSEAADPPSEGPSGEADELSSEDTQQASGQSTSIFQPFDTSGTIEETTLVDNEYFTLVANGLSYKNNNAVLSVTVTNNSDIPITVMSNTLAYSCNYINDWMVTDGGMHCDVEPGATETDEMIFSTGTLMLYGIHGIGELGLGINADDDDYNEIFRDCVSLRTSLYDAYKSGELQSASFEDPILNLYGLTADYSSDDTLFDQGGVAVVSEKMVSKDDGSVLMLEVANNNDSLVGVQISDVFVNGELACEGTWVSGYLAANKKRMIDFDYSSLAAYRNSGDSEDEEDPSFGAIEATDFSISVVDGDMNTLVPPSEIKLAF